MSRKVVTAFIDAVSKQVVVESRVPSAIFADHEPSYVTATARAMIKRGERERAATLLEDSLKRYPDDALMHGQLGTTYLAMAKRMVVPPVIWSSDADRLEILAAHHYETASHLKPDDYQFAINAGTSAEAQGRNIDALLFFRRAAGAAPQRANPWVRLGNFFAREPDHLPMAKICFQNAVRVEPQDFFARNRLERLGDTPDYAGQIDFTPLGFTPLRARHG